MNENGRIIAPTAQEIQRRFKSPAVVISRPVILGAIGVLRAARRFGWNGEGLSNIKNLDGPIVFAANHQSHTDTAAILGTLPKRMRDRTAVAAALDVFGGNGTGAPPSLKRECLQLFVAAGFHAFAFDRHRSPLRSIRTAAELIENGWNLLLYPEGTRSRTGKMAQFKAGVGVLARFTQRPVVPIHVAGGRAILPCGATIPRPGRLTVRYGKPVFFEQGESTAEFTQRIQDCVRNLSPAYKSRSLLPNNKVQLQQT